MCANNIFNFILCIPYVSGPCVRSHQPPERPWLSLSNTTEAGAGLGTLNLHSSSCSCFSRSLCYMTCVAQHLYVVCIVCSIIYQGYDVVYLQPVSWIVDGAVMAVGSACSINIPTHTRCRTIASNCGSALVLRFIYLT